MIETAEIKCTNCGQIYNVIVLEGTKVPLGTFICPTCGTKFKV